MESTNRGNDEETPADPYDLRLDQELKVVQNLRSTMQSLLRVLESGRDDLVVLGDSMDKVRLASERCRNEFLKQQHQSADSSAQSPKPEKSSPTKRKRQGEGLIGKTRKST